MSKEIQISRCYSLVFRDEPWKEAFTDDKGNFYGPEYDLTWRQNGLNRAYPLVDTAGYIEKETTRPGSVVVLNEEGRRIIAFGWGYSVPSVGALVDEKWKMANERNKQELTAKISASVATQPFWYLSEVGVLSDKRRNGLATQVVAKMLKEAPIDQDVVMRTNANSPMTVIAEKFGFEQILGPRTSRDSGRIIVSAFESVNGLDPVNPARVLYVLPKERMQV